jgi:Tol biopolymer transport system component
VARLGILLTLAAVHAVSPAASVPAHTLTSNGWIVFASNRAAVTGTFRLYRLEPAGGRVAALGALAGRKPAWSPDGSLIAFVGTRQRLVVARADGTWLRALTGRGVVAEDPAWSPDGSRVVFKRLTRRRYRGDLAIVRADASGGTRVLKSRHDDIQPSWSPDGSLIAFSSNRGPGNTPGDREIWVVRPTGLVCVRSHGTRSRTSPHPGRRTGA